ncbi:MAG: hypothetical protein Q4G26_00965 [Paracoccus sp. (in: a-proteobacteria)]|nr:hypothetical protein [Paracoccus sp. (in: a-proteobacteria)]
MPRVMGAFLGVSLLPVAALSLQPSAPVPGQVPEKAQGLMAGCGDIPEVVELVERLRMREDRIAVALAELDRRKAEIATARTALTAELRRLKSASGGTAASRTNRQRAVDDDIQRLVAVYEAMKPKEAAAVLASLPPDFSAEILMRVTPETGARIMAATEPEKAAVLTTYMGARSAASK